MNKIPTLFKRDPENMKRVLDEVHPDCQWVLDGEGIATRKYEGTCVMLDDRGFWWARREVKKGKEVPPNYLYISTDPNSEAQMGYEPITQSSFYKPFNDAMVLNQGHTWEPGTYELCGPKINGNPEKLERHDLFSHDRAERIEGKGPHEPETIKNLVRLTVAFLGWEGVVWHHPDGRMAKLKVRDFPVEASA